jgi:hypothetical protein
MLWCQALNHEDTEQTPENDGCHHYDYGSFQTGH